MHIFTELSHTVADTANSTLPKRPRLNLPFVKRRRDVGTVVYDHRAGIYAVVILFLAVAILFIGSKVVIRTPESTDGILVDLRTVEELREEARRLEREVRLRQSEADDAFIRNAISNEGAELRDDRNTDMSNLRDRLDDATGGLDANRDAWDQGMRESNSMKGDRSDRTGNANNDSRAKGTVLVSFSLAFDK